MKLEKKPDQQQDIQVEILNSSKEDIKVNVHITNPTTTRTGLIDYTRIDTDTDDSLKTPITDIASVDKQTVSIPAEESVLVPIHLDMPSKSFDGVILGGIYFKKQANDEDENKDAVQLKNQYSYVLGLKLSETDKIIDPELHLKNVEIDLVNYKQAVITSIQNKSPVIIDNMELNATITDSKGNEVNEVHVEDYRMAPNSVLPFAIDWNDNKFKPGIYNIDLEAKVGSKTWDWQDEFEVKKQEAENLNKDAVETNTGNNLIWYIVIGFSIVIVILICIIVWLLRRNKLTKDNHSANNNRDK